MNVLGIIAEYNPFHNGHMFHLTNSKHRCNADYTVCVMSGNFVQRGEPAIVNKWVRTKMALTAGIDLVIELPCIYSLSSAESFAYGAVKLLDSLGFVTHLSFGSECADIHSISKIADVLVKEDEIFKCLLKKLLKKGLSFPSARQAALHEYFNATGENFQIDNVIGCSNNILGIEYIKALKILDSSIIPTTIARTSNSYTQKDLSGFISSATSIRNSIENGLFESTELKNTMPSFAYEMLKEEFMSGKGPVFSSHYENSILTLLRTLSCAEIKDMPYITEGLENRLKKAGLISSTMQQLIINSSTKRYTKTRLNRIMFNLLIGIKKNDVTSYNNNGGPQYIRILGMNDNGKSLLAKAASTSSLPIMVKTGTYKKSCNPLFISMFEAECRSTDVYVLGYKNPEYKKGSQDMTHNPVIISLQDNKILC